MYIVALALSVLCFIGVLAFFWRSPSFSLFHPLTFYSAFHGLLFVVRPIFAYVYDYRMLYYAYQFTPSESDRLTVIFASNLGFLAFALFCLRSGSVPMQFRNSPVVQEERRRLSQIFIWVIAICGPLAAWSMLRGYSSTTDQSMVLDRATGVFINTGSSGYATDLQLMAVSICALIVWLGRFRPITFVPIIAFVLLRAGTGGRGPFVAALVSAGLFYLYEKRLRFPGMRVVLAVVLVTSLFTAVGADRGASIRVALGLEDASLYEDSDEGKLRPLESMDFGNKEFFEYLVYAIPQRTGTYGYFLNNFQVFTEPVPRKLWPGKPVGEPFRRFYLFEYGNPIGMTRSLPGEGWYSLGWLGVIMWCGLWGHLLGLIYRRFVNSEQTTFQTAFYMVFMPTLVVAFRDGGLITLVKQTGIYFTPIVVWWLLARYMGVPRAKDLAALIAGRASAGGAVAAPRAAVAAALLPPAVQRRRAMLAGDAAERTAE